MFLFKTSGQTLGSVVANQKHAFRGKPRDWHHGELVLVSKNRADCAPGEKQIQYLMKLDAIRPLKPGESEQFWPGTEGRWRYLVQCFGTQRLTCPFDLHDALGPRAHEYGAVMTYKRLDSGDELRVMELLRNREPGISL